MSLEDRSELLAWMSGGGLLAVFGDPYYRAADIINYYYGTQLNMSTPDGYQSSAELDPSITGTVLQQYIGGYANTYPFSLQGGLVGVSPAQPLVVNAYANYENAQGWVSLFQWGFEHEFNTTLRRAVYIAYDYTDGPKDEWNEVIFMLINYTPRPLLYNLQLNPDYTPVDSSIPTKYPTRYPSPYTRNPTNDPTKFPTYFPSISPSFSPTFSPSASPSLAPTIDAVFLESGKLYQLGGPHDYQPSAGYPGNILLRNPFLNRIYGNGEAYNRSTITCLYDTDALAALNRTMINDKSEVAPWRFDNEAWAYNYTNYYENCTVHDPWNCHEVVGFTDFVLEIYNVILDFDYRSAAAQLGYNDSVAPGVATHCGYFGVRELRISDTVIRGVDRGFMLGLRGAYLRMSRVTIILPSHRRKGGIMRNMIMMQAPYATVEMYDSEFQDYYVSESFIRATGDPVTIEIQNLTVSNITGSSTITDWSMLPSEEKEKYDMGMMCWCNDTSHEPCFREENYCYDTVQGNLQFNFHALSLIHGWIGRNSSFSVTHSKFDKVSGFSKGLVAYVESTRGYEATTLLYDSIFTSCSLGDRAWVTRQGVGVLPNGTHPDQYAGVLAFSGLAGVANVSKMEYKNDAMYRWSKDSTNLFEGAPNDYDDMNLLMEYMPRPVLVRHNTTRTAVHVIDTIISHSEMEALIHDTHWDLNTNNKDLEDLTTYRRTEPELSYYLTTFRAMNSHTVHNVQIINATYANSGKFHINGQNTMTRHMSVVMAVNHAPHALFISNVTLDGSDHSVLHSVANHTGVPEPNPEVLDVILNIKDITYVRAKPFAGNAHESGMFVLMTPWIQYVRYNITFERIGVNHVGLSDALVSIGCVNYVKLVVKDIDVYNTNTNSTLFRLPACVDDGRLTMLRCMYDNIVGDIIQIYSKTWSVYLDEITVNEETNGSLVVLEQGTGTMWILNTTITNSSTPSLKFLTADANAAEQTIVLKHLQFSYLNGPDYGVIHAVGTQLWNVTLQSCEFRHNWGTGTAYGGVLRTSGKVFIHGCTFLNNSAYDGGALYVANALIRNSTFSNNFALNYGGSIVAANLDIEHLTFSNTSASQRGGLMQIAKILSETSADAIINDVVVEYSSSNLGGLMYIDRDAAVIITNSKVEAITSSTGTIFAADGCSLEVKDTTFHNLKTSDGGLIQLMSKSTAVLHGITGKNFDVGGFGGVAFLQNSASLHVNSSYFSNLTVRANGGAFYLPIEATVRVYNSRFIDITAVTGCLLWVLTATVELEDLYLQKIHCTSTGGIIRALSGTSLTATRINATNILADRGAFAHIDGSVQAVVSHSYFENMEADFSAALAVVDEEATFQITDSFIRNSKAQRSSVIEVAGTASKTTLERFYAYDMTTTVGVGGISFSGSSTGFINDCAFFRITQNGDGLAASAAISTYGSSTVTINNTIITDNDGLLGAGISTNGQASLYVYDTTITKNFATLGGAGMYLGSTGSIRVRNVTLTNNTGDAQEGDAGSLWLEGATDSEFHHCIINDNSALNGGAAKIVFSNVLMNDCQLGNNVASDTGGAVVTVNSTANFTNCEIFNNTAMGGTGGGMVILQAEGGIISDTSIYNNRANGTIATANKGGGVAIFGVRATSARVVFLSNVRIFNNYAEGGAGGGVYWDRDNSQPDLSGAIFGVNYATQGSNVASGVHQAIWNADKDVFVPSNAALNFSLFVNITDYYAQLVIEPTPVTLETQTISTSRGVGTFTGSKTQITNEGWTCFGSKCPHPANTGLFFISAPLNNFTFAAKATATFSSAAGSSSFDLITQSSNLRVQDCGAGQLRLPEECINCQPGYYQNNTNPTNDTVCIPCAAGSFASTWGSKECILCSDAEGGRTEDVGASICVQCDENRVPNEPGTRCESCVTNARHKIGVEEWWECVCIKNYFSYERDFINRNPSECLNCPLGGNCLDFGVTDMNINPQKRFWLSPYETDVTFIKCRNLACEGVRDECATGYRGTLCTECIEGYGRYRDYECLPCLGGAIMALFRFMGAVMFVCLIGVLLTVINVAEAENEMTLGQDTGQWDRVATLAKITLSAAQFNSVAADFDYEWPSFVKGVLDTQGAIGDMGSFLNVDCAQGRDARPKAIYVESLLVAGIPLAIPILSLFTILLLKVKDHYTAKKLQEDLEIRKAKEEKRKELMRRLGIAPEHANRLKEGQHGEKSLGSQLSESKGESKLDSKEGKDSVKAKDSSPIDSKHGDEGDEKEVKNEKALMEKKRANVGFDMATAQYDIKGEDGKHYTGHGGFDFSARFWASSMSLFFMIYPSLVLQAFKLFHCETLGSTPNSIVLAADMSEICYQSPHWEYQMLLGAPMILAYGIGYPAFCLWWLVRYRKHMPVHWKNNPKVSDEERREHIKHTMPIYLFYHGYKHQYFVYEIFIMFRKVTIVFFAVFVNAAQIQALLAILLVVSSIMLQIRIEPFDDEIANKVEIAGLFSSFTIYFLGAFLYIAPEYAKSLVSSLIVIICVTFFSVVLWMMWKEIRKNYRSWREGVARRARKKKPNVMVQKYSEKTGKVKMIVQNLENEISSGDSEEGAVEGPAPAGAKTGAQVEIIGRDNKSSSQSGMSRSGIISGKILSRSGHSSASISEKKNRATVEAKAASASGFSSGVGSSMGHSSGTKKSRGLAIRPKKKKSRLARPVASRPVSRGVSRGSSNTAVRTFNIQGRGAKTIQRPSASPLGRRQVTEFNSSSSE
ncbi:hypothetical protein AAMO2058_001080100 [Amorphochlora amoebiformis]